MAYRSTIESRSMQHPIRTAFQELALEIKVYKRVVKSLDWKERRRDEVTFDLVSTTIFFSEQTINS